MVRVFKTIAIDEGFIVIGGAARARCEGDIKVGASSPSSEG